MAGIVKLVIQLEILCMIVSLASAAGVFAFSLGDWRIAGIQVYWIFAASTLAALFVMVLQNLAFKPMFFKNAGTLAKQMLLAADVYVPSDRQRAFMDGAIDAQVKYNTRRYVIAAVIGVVIYFLLGAQFGSPLAEYTAIAIQLLGPTLVGMLTQGGMNTMRAMDPESFDTASEAYSTAGNLDFDLS